METPAKFKAIAGDPVLLEVEASDGRVYELRVQVAVMRVVESDATTADGYPAFNIQCTLGVMTTRKV